MDGSIASDIALADGLPVVRTRVEAGQGWGTLRYLHEAAGLLRARRESNWLLHCNHLFAGYAGWWLRRRCGLPYVVWVHGEELSKSRHRSLVRASLAGASALLTNSEFTANMLRGDLGSAAPPIHKIPLGARPEWLRPELSTERVAENGRIPTILTVARLSRRDRYKGVDVALGAMRELARRGREFSYRIAGDGDDRNYLEGLAKSAGIADRVEFLGAVPGDQLPALYDACDIFLLCSREERTPRGLGFEGFGIVFLEANARGKPVVGGRSGGIPDAVLDGETGLLADPLSPVAVADAVEKLLLDPELRARLGAQGRRRVLAHYNWDAAAAQVRELHLNLSRGGER